MESPGRRAPSSLLPRVPRKQMGLFQQPARPDELRAKLRDTPARRRRPRDRVDPGAALAEPNAPLDVVEDGDIWGASGSEGYPKHPPRVAWVTEAAVVLGGGLDRSANLTSQLAMVTFSGPPGGSAASCLPGAALLGAAVLECCLYYHFTTSEANNVALCPSGPAGGSPI